MHAVVCTTTTGNAALTASGSQGRMPANVLKQNAIRLNADAAAGEFNSRCLAMAVLKKLIQIFGQGNRFGGQRSLSLHRKD